MKMKIFFLLFMLLFLAHCKSNQENWRLMGNMTANFGENNSRDEYFPTSSELYQREKRTASFMTIPSFTFEYFWKTFVTRFFISQNMQNYDVTTWPNKFYQKGKYHFANEKNTLTALKKTFFLTRTDPEKENLYFLATATQAAILQMSDRSAAYLVERYKKHIIDVELKEHIEPPGKFKRIKKPKQLKTFLEEMFLVDLERKVIPMLKTDGEKENFKNIILESLEGENLLLLMNDLRLFEKEWNGKKERSPATDLNLHHHQNDAVNEEDGELLNKWLESDGETNYFGAISRLFKDLDSDEMSSKLLVIRQNDGLVHLNEEYMKEYYFHGIKLIFEHIAERANEQLQGGLSTKNVKQQQQAPQKGVGSEIQEVGPSIDNNEQTKTHKLYILNELRKATYFIFSEYADKLNHHESDLIELNEKFFPGEEIVKEKMNELEMQLKNILNRLKNNKNEEQLQKSGPLETEENVLSSNLPTEQQQENKKSGKKLFHSFLQAIKKLGGKKIPSKGREKTEKKEEEKSDNEKGIVENEQNMVAESMNNRENFNTIVLEMIDICKYVIKQKEDEEKEWDEQMERNHKQLCQPNSVVQINLNYVDPKLRRKLKRFCEHFQEIINTTKPMKKSRKANNKLKTAFQNIWQKTESFFHHSYDNRFVNFLKKQCENLEKKIEEDNEKLKESHLIRLKILEETKEQSKQRMEKMSKRECLFENEKLLMILKRYFKLETEGILTIEWPEDEEKKKLKKKGKKNIRIQRSIGLEFLVVFAMVEPIIETTILQQIFRQWNFYKWIHRCIQRSWRYKEVRCKEPVVIAEERQFAGMVSTTIFEELTKEGAENICHLYKRFVDEKLRPLNKITIKYPSALLKELGIKLSSITKDLMDIAWRKINALPYLLKTELDELKEIWLKQISDAKEQRVWDESWAYIAEFLTLTSKMQHQWIVSKVFCANNEKYSQVECLHRKWEQIGKEADIKGDLKLRVKSNFEKSSANIKIAYFFELIMMRREDLFGYIFRNLLHNDDIHIDLGLILPIISIGGWLKIKSFLRIYAGNNKNEKKKNDQTFISEQFELAILNKEEIISKFILKLLKGRFERIMLNEGRYEVVEKGKIAMLFENYQNYVEEGNIDKKNKIGDEIIDGMKKVIMSFDQNTINEMKNFEPNFIKSEGKEKVKNFEPNFIKSEGKEEVKRTNLEVMMTKNKTQIFLKKISNKLKEMRPKYENFEGKQEEKIKSNLNRNEELNILIEILIMSGLLGENSQFKYIARRLRKSVLDTKFKDVRLVIANHLGLNFSKVLENYKGGIEQAYNEAGMWKIRGDIEKNTLKIKFWKIYKTILKHFATNFESIQEAEKEGEEYENNIKKENIDKIKNLINLLKMHHQLMMDEKKEEKNEQNICDPIPTQEWIRNKFSELSKHGGSNACFDEIYKTLPKKCYQIIAEGFENLLKEITVTETEGGAEIVLFKGETSGTKADRKEIETEIDAKEKGEQITMDVDKLEENSSLYSTADEDDIKEEKESIRL